MSPTSVLDSLRELRDAKTGEQPEVIHHAIKLIEEMGEQIVHLKGMASRPFRRSSEKLPPGQLAMDFICQLVAQSQAEREPEAQPAPDVPKPRPRTKRRSKTHLLPIIKQVKALDEAQRACGACGADKAPMGVEVNKRIVFEPARLFMLEEHCTQYACRACGNGVVVAPATPKLVSGSTASSSLLAHLVVSKVIDCLPIERIGRQLERHGAELAPSTLNDWFGQAGSAVADLQPRIRLALRDADLISVDDTPFLAHNRAHDQNIQRGRLWLYLADIDKLTYCAFTPDWKGSHPREVLQGFAGHIQSDGYAGLTPLFGTGPAPPTRVGCNDHARRKFVEALKLGDTRAKPVVDAYAQLYAVERQATEAGGSAVQRYTLRQAHSVSIWAQVQDLVEALVPVANRKGPLGRAVTYWRNQRATLNVFLDDGRLPISNAHVERLLRTVALLRKNALFVGSLAAGERYAALLTLALNCTLCGANAFDYFAWLFDRLAEGWPAKKTLELLPQAWLRAQNDAG